MKDRFTASGARRRGDEYQDIQAIDILVDWLEHNDRYQWVKLEADNSGFLDDVLAMPADGVLEIAQVKYSTAPHKADDFWTWDDLLEQKKGKKGPTRSLLQKWFQTWQKYRNGNVETSPRLISNRSAADELRLDTPRGGRVRWDELPDDVRPKILMQLGTEREVQEFFEAFQFRLNDPSLRELEKAARTRFDRLGGMAEGWYALEKSVREWTNLKNNPPPNGQITLEIVQSIAKLKPFPVRLQRFLPPSAFFEPYLDQSRLFHHCLPQVGRRDQLNALLDFVSGANQVLILPGRGGSGKSKLLHTLCRRVARRYPALSVRLATENLPIEQTALAELPDDECLIIVDDAHRTEGLEILLATARQNPKLKIFLVTRPHATDYLAMQATSAGFDRHKITICPTLPELNFVRHQRRLARLALGRDWADYADDLARATRDSPLLTVLGGQLLRTEQVLPASLRQNERFRQEVLTRFRDITLGKIISHLDARFTPELCANLLPYVAGLSPFDVEHEQLMQAVSRLLHTDEVKLKQLIGTLVKGGALVQGRRLVRIVPDVLSDFILQDACFTPDGMPTGWANQLYQAVAEFRLDVVLRNLAELDWRVRTASDSSTGQPFNETNLLDSIWLDIQNRFRASTLAERKAWLSRLERLAFIQAERMWPLIEIALNEPAIEKPDETSESLRLYLQPVTQANVLTATIPILRSISHDDRFTSKCADLLWEMGRDLETESGHSPSAIQTLRELASFEYGKDATFSYILLVKCREWMNDPNVHNYRHSILEVIGPMLARQYSWTGSDRRWRVSGRFKLPSEPYKHLRQGALKLVEQCALSGNQRTVLQALMTLKAPVSEEGLWGLKEENPTEWHKWEEEQLSAIQIIQRVIKINDDPFINLRIWEVLHSQAANGPRPEVKRKARELLDGLPHSVDSRFLLLVTDSHAHEEYDGDWEELEREHKLSDTRQTHLDRRFSEKSLAFAREVTSEWVAHYPDPSEGFDAFDEWIGRIETSGWWTDFWTRSNSFLIQLATDNPDYARAWCEIAPEKPESRTTNKCDDLLCELRRQDQKDALIVAQGFLTKNHPNLWLQVASSYSWRCWPQKPLPEEWQLVRDLLAFPHAQVKRTAAQILSSFAPIDFKRALNLILATYIGEDSELANTLFEVFEERRGFDFAILTKNDLGTLLDKLKDVETIRSYHLGRFLLQSALREPVLVAQFLLTRVKLKVILNQKKHTKSAANASSLMNVLQRFGGLPEAGFHEEAFKQIVTHPSFKDGLRIIRDAALSNHYKTALLFEDTLSELFHDFSVNYSPASLEVLEEWINSGECTKVKAAMTLLEDTYLGFYLQNLDFVSNYLKRAQTCGNETYEEVERAMLHCAEYGPPRAMTPISGQRSNALFHQAGKMIETIKDDPLMSHFFAQLRDRGQERIRKEMRDASDEEVFFRTW